MRFKLFEEYKKYSPGDWVLLNVDMLDNNGDEIDGQFYAIIDSIEYDRFGTFKFYHNGKWYEYNNSINRIVRLISPEEIENFKMNIQIKKFNL